MFVAAESFSAEVREGIFTHFRREEDATMESGKLDEELSRMSGIVDATIATLDGSVQRILFGDKRMGRFRNCYANNERLARKRRQSIVRDAFVRIRAQTS